VFDCHIRVVSTVSVPASTFAPVGAAGPFARAASADRFTLATFAM
jgi:hypothetical protein